MINIAYAMGQGGKAAGSTGGFPLLFPLIIIGLFVWFVIIKRKKPWENRDSSSQALERSQTQMKKIGIILIMIGLIALLSSLSMDVSISTGYYGKRIVNADLLNQRQNYVIVSSLILIIGFGITLMQRFIKTTSDQAPQENISVGTKKCPYCAELIQEEAIVCRYCNRDLDQAA